MKTPRISPQNPALAANRPPLQRPGTEAALRPTVEKSPQSNAQTAQDPGAVANASAKPAHRRLLRVWMVDDDAILREAFAQLLNHESWLRVSRQFFSVGAVLAALEEERPPDIILLDLNLGNETGLSAIAPIRKLAPTVKVLMLTTFNDTHSEAEAFRLGASGFLLKLYDIQEIIALIHEAFYHPEDPRLFPNLSFDQRTKKHAVHLEAAPKKRSPFVTGLRQLFRPRKRQSAA